MFVIRARQLHSESKATITNVIKYVNRNCLTKQTLQRLPLTRTFQRYAGTCSTHIPEFSDNERLQSYQDLHRYSLENPDQFWGTLAKNRLEWIEDFQHVNDSDIAAGKISWFAGGKLNVSVNCVDRHYKRSPNDTALLWERDEPGEHQIVSYKDLYEMMNQIANTLKCYGVSKGSRVVLYMPTCPIAVATMLACARIGAMHSIVFAGFSAEALASRITDAGADTVITTDHAVRGGKLINLKQTVDNAVAKCPSIRNVFVSQRTGLEVPMGKLDKVLEKEMSQQPTECPAEVMSSSDPLFLLYTSGSTGQPKGIVHSSAGYLLYANVTQQMVFDYSPGDVFGCLADIGWITGHSYVVYGPLSNGATSVLFESTPTYPDPSRYWEMVERLKINQLYLAPTALRLLLKYDNHWFEKHDRSSLKSLGCVGEPLNHEAWEWFNDLVAEKRCPLVDTWWQTETGGICIAPRPSEANAHIEPAMPMRPFFGIDPVLIDTQGQEMVLNDVHGTLCIRKPWPGLAMTIYGDHQRFVDTYFKVMPGYYCTGDGALRSADGYYKITGRMDDVINVSGHRLGTAEIEDVMDEHHLVAETAVVAYPHDVKGDGIYAYVTLKEYDLDETTDEIIDELKGMVRKQIAGYAVPEMIQIAPALPKTRSGKIMRRILRKVAANQTDDLGDISTLADPSVVAAIVKNHEVLMENGLRQKVKI